MTLVRLIRKLIAALEGFALHRRGDQARRCKKAQQLATTLLHELDRLGFTRKVGTRKHVSYQRVKFEYPLVLTPEELWCPINLRKLPVGVRTDDLRDETVLHSLEDRLGAAVRFDYLRTGKFCYVIRLQGAAFPERFPIGAVTLPVEAPPLAFPLGIDGSGEQLWSDLAKLPHLLIVGPTGKGKSTFVHDILTTWISRNEPYDIELWLADHKGGVELNRYQELAAKRNKEGIIRRFTYKPEETIGMLQAALKEIDRRLDILRSNDCSDLGDLARMTGRYLRPIAIVIDEIFFLMLNKEKIDPEAGKGKKSGYTIRDWAEQLFAKIASAGRAPGVHLIIATQKTGKDVLTSLITANFETRAIFGVASMYESIYVLGNSAAVGLPKGRIIFRAEGGEMLEVQTPYISADQTRLIISRIARYGPDGGLGHADESRRLREDAKLLVNVACDYFQGAFAIRQIYQHDQIKGVVNKARVEEVGRILERDGVLESGGPRRARRVARAVFNRPELLDAMYGPQPGDAELRPETLQMPPGHTQDVTDSLESDPEKADTSRALGNAEKPDSELRPERPDTSCVLENRPTCAPDPALPGFVDSFLYSLDESREPTTEAISTELTKPKHRRRNFTFTPEHVDQLITARAYTEVKDAVRDLKFHGETQHAPALAKLLAEALMHAAIRPDFLVPVPLHPKRQTERGFNQSEVLVIEVANHTSAVIRNELERTRWTVPQAGLREAHRANNVAGAFTWKGEDLEGKTIVLIDDVISTGATVDSCAHALKAAGAAKVIALVCAKAGDIPESQNKS